MSQPTPPLHAEVRAAVAREINNYFGNTVNLSENGTLVNRVIQVVADALLAGLPPERPKRDVKNELDSIADYVDQGFNQYLDAVTRVIGELRGDSN